MKRVNPLEEENAELREQVRVLQAELNSALEHIDGVMATVDAKDRHILRITIENEALKRRRTRD